MYIPAKIRPPIDPDDKGLPVLKLPKLGSELREGRQYELTPLARAIVKDRLGITLPRVVECTHKERPAMRYATHALNLETGEATWSVLNEEHQEATFRAWMSLGKIHRFTLDLAWLAEREHEASLSDKAREIELEDEKDLPKSIRERLEKSRAPKAPRASSKPKLVERPVDILSLLNLNGLV